MKALWFFAPFLWFSHIMFAFPPCQVMRKRCLLLSCLLSSIFNMYVINGNLIPSTISQVIDFIYLSAPHTKDLDNPRKKTVSGHLWFSLSYFISDFPEREPDPITAQNFPPIPQKFGRTQGSQGFTNCFDCSLFGRAGETGQVIFQRGKYGKFILKSTKHITIDGGFGSTWAKICLEMPLGI